MCLETVDKKLKAKEYQMLKDVVADLGQIFNNAKRCKLFLNIGGKGRTARLTERQTTRRSRCCFNGLSVYM